MTIKSKADAKKDFNAAAKGSPSITGESAGSAVKADSPEPVLKPTGSWANRAAAVNQRVREEQEARKAKRMQQNKDGQEAKEWTRSLRSSFNPRGR